MPRISVVTPTYNRADLLDDAIESVLNQKLNDLEHIIIDDGSDDDTAEIVNQFQDSRIKYIRHKQNKGASSARNTGIESASGEFLSFLDSDDKWTKNHLKSQLSVLEEKDDSYIGVYSDVGIESDAHNNDLMNVIFNILQTKKENPAKEGGQKLLSNLLTGKVGLSPGSSLTIRKSAINPVGLFDESFNRQEDIDFVIRLLKHGKIAYCPENTVKLRSTSRPPAQLIDEAHHQLRSKHADLIEELEANGHSVQSYHNFKIGKMYLEDGYLLQAARLLVRSKPPTIRRVNSLFPQIPKGLKKSIKRHKTNIFY